MKLIVHIDLNAFFVQVEELLDPSLKSKCVAVGGNTSRSVVSTANYAARKRGVNSGMSIKMAKELCPDLLIIDGNYRLYHDYSERFFNYLRKKFNQIEQTSIDECYIDMTQYFDKEHARDFLRDLQVDLFKETDLKCSIGCGENRFLAKMGSDYQKPLGLTLIFKEDVERILWPIPIEKMYGIGKKTAPKLINLGIKTIGDLAQTEDKKVKDLLGNSFLHYQNHANGEGSDELNYGSFDPTSVSAARTFNEDTCDDDELSNMIIHLSKQVSNELKEHNKTARCVIVTFRTSDFITTSKRMQFDTYSNEAAKIASRALQIYETYYNFTPLRLIGVGVADAINVEDVQEQLNIFQVSQKRTKKNEVTIENIIESLNKSSKIKFQKASEIKKQNEKRKKDGEYQGRFHIPEEEK